MRIVRQKDSTLTDPADVKAWPVFAAVDEFLRRRSRVFTGELVVTVVANQAQVLETHPEVEHP